ncbi:MAG: carboxyl transferase domain-containing protein, partial [Candidatus Omnitrophota bacterium]
MSLFGKPKYTVVKIKKKEMPDGLWTKCEECFETLYNKTLEENLRVCPKCNYHFTLDAVSRVNLLMDKDTFKEFDADMLAADPLEFKGPKTYIEKLDQDKKATNLKDAVITGEGLINGHRAVLAVTDSRFIMGSMGSVVGEKITRAVEFATAGRLPVIIVSGSGGGA